VANKLHKNIGDDMTPHPTPATITVFGLYVSINQSNNFTWPK